MKPVPKDEAFGTLPPPSSVQDPDLAYAIRLQQEELQRIASARQHGVYAGAAGTAGAGYGALQVPSRGRADSAMLAPAPSFGGGIAPPGSGIPRNASYRQAGSSSAGHGSAGSGGGGSSMRGGGRGGWLALTTLLLLATTVAWITLFVVSLAKSSWNLADLSINPWAGATQVGAGGCGTGAGGRVCAAAALPLSICS